MPTRRRTSIAFSRASCRVYFPCARSPSAICQPTGYTGFSAVEGSWNTIAASRPRTSPSWRRESVTTSCSSAPSLLVSSTAPRVVAVSGSRPRMLRAVTVLPLPLSPTIARTWPASTDRLTSLTAATVPASVAKLNDRLSMSTTSVIARLPPRSAPRSLALPAMISRASLSRESSRPLSFAGSFQARQPAQARAERAARHHGHVGRVGHLVGRRAPAGPQPGVGEVVEALADQRQPEHDPGDGQARPQRGPPDATRDVGQGLPQVEAPFGRRRRLDTEPEETQRGEGGNRLGRVQGDDQRQRARGV